MRSSIVIVLAFLFGLMNAPSVKAEVMVKHPRVAELEDKLSRDASSYLKGRFPDRPFLITVSIDPLRRTNKASPEEKERIPFLDLQGEEIQDEWDDPQVSLQQLMLRVKRVTVSLSLPNSINDDEADEVKTSLYSVLHLTPARDTVEVIRRKWATGPQNWSYAAMTLAALALFLLGFYFIGNRSAARFAQALKELKAQSSTGSSGPTIAHVTALPGAAAYPGTPSGHGENGSKNLKLSDPIRIRELIRGLIDTVTAHDSFPTLSDVLTLDEFGKRDSSGLGSILVELPPAIQKKLFAITGDISHWLEAFHKPGVLGIDSLNTLENLSRTLRDDVDPEWERLMIYIWRLGSQAPAFMQQLNPVNAMTVLEGLPKSISIRIARGAFPGNWGNLLKNEFSRNLLSATEIREISRRAIEYKPLLAYSNLTQYQNDLELLDYLRGVEIAEERDIYGAAPADSLIRRLRKPFYPLFDQSRETLQSIVPRISLEEWALALLNVTIPERRKIDVHFTEKQRYLFIERLKFYDIHPPQRSAISASRDKVGRILSDYLEADKRVSEQKRILEQSLEELVVDNGEVKKNAA